MVEYKIFHVTSGVLERRLQSMTKTSTLAPPCLASLLRRDTISMQAMVTVLSPLLV